jgi:hypothetical protein
LRATAYVKLSSSHIAAYAIAAKHILIQDKIRHGRMRHVASWRRRFEHAQKTSGRFQ